MKGSSYEDAPIIPISAQKGIKIDFLLQTIEEVIPKINPTNEFSSTFPKAIIIIQIVAIKIEIQTFKEICSFKKINAKRAVKKGIAAKHNKKNSL